MNFQKIACFFGFHRWRYTPAQYRTPLDERLAIPLKDGERVCEHCQKRQIEDSHCLGLTPPGVCEHVAHRSPNRAAREGLSFVNNRAF